MPGLERKVLDLLTEGGVVGADVMYERIYGENPRPEPGIFKVVICRLRARGYPIETVWGRGWRLAI